MERKTLAVSAVLTAVAAGVAWATVDRNVETMEPRRLEAVGNVLDVPTQSNAGEANRAALEARVARGEELDVGDAATFGKPMKWLGTMSSPRFVFRKDCTNWRGSSICHPIYAWGGGSASDGIYRNLAHITLPPKALDTMLCHWQTVSINANFYNEPDNITRPVTVEVYPWITVENEVLNDPGLIDPDSEMPLDGKITLGMPSTAVNGQLTPGSRLRQSENATRTCVGGMLTRANLREYWGLSEKQAEEFFSKPTRLTLNLTSNAWAVENGSYQVSYRFVGY